MALNDELATELVHANRILGNEEILDAYGHVSMRDPDVTGSFVMSVARAPGLVSPTDLVNFSIDSGEPLDRDDRPIYIERFIHAAIYAARPDVNAICHNHALSILPFSISPTNPLRSVIHVGRFMGGKVPVWDIADDFGPDTSLLVRCLDHAQSLTRALGGRDVALMRGHGSVVVAQDLHELVERCVDMDRNARVQLAAHSLGQYQPLHEGECKYVIERLSRGDDRAWNYFVDRLTPRP